MKGGTWRAANGAGGVVRVGSAVGGSVGRNGWRTGRGGYQHLLPTAPQEGDALIHHPPPWKASNVKPASMMAAPARRWRVWGSWKTERPRSTAKRVLVRFTAMT
jgi:hypothetical protein